MEDYRKSNESIHVPGALKEWAAQPRRPYRRLNWLGGVAAVLAAAIALTAVLLPGGRSMVAHASDHVLVEATYPSMAPYPNLADYYTSSGKFDMEGYHAAYGVWQESVAALGSQQDYTGVLATFLSASAAQFLGDCEGENRVFSPLNVYLALAMLAETTDGNSRQQLLDLLGASSLQALREQTQALWTAHYRDDGLTAILPSNSIWLNRQYDYFQQPLNILAQYYYASSFSGEMGSEAYNQALREWLSQQTGGLLGQEGVDSAELLPETILALVSTLYFQADWQNKFQAALTQPGPFHAPGGDVTAQFMHQNTFSTYYRGPGFSAVSLPFRDAGQMWLLLPDEGVTPDQLLASGEAMDFLLAPKQGEETSGPWEDQEDCMIHLSLPKFDVSSQLDLTEGLKALGVSDVFDPSRSNFNPLTDFERVFVSSVAHAGRVLVDEEGCQAASYTVIYAVTGAPREKVDFVLDRPFLFAVTGLDELPLFLGVVNTPNS